MTKVIRVKDSTFEELIKRGKLSDTMDAIVSKLLKEDEEDNKKIDTQ
jgi:uncharacterized protein YehS (DUF1456 family)